MTNDKLHIVHIASHSINVGDGAITSGIRRALADIYPGEISYTNIEIVDYEFFGQELSAAYLDALGGNLILVGGGGTIDGHTMRLQNGTAFTMTMDEMKLLQTPIAFVALGHNQFNHQRFYHRDILHRFLEFCYTNDIPFSLRNDGSRERIIDLLEHDISGLADIVPDPGFFIKTPEQLPSPVFPPTTTPKVVLQLAFDAYQHRFGGADVDYKGNFKSFVSSISEYATHLIDEYNASIAIATHTSDDLQGATEVLRNVERKKARLNIRSTGVYHPTYAPMFFKAYAEADLVVGMRGHSVICGAGLDRPTIAISTHPKVAGFMSKIGGICYEPPISDDVYESLLIDTRHILTGHGEEYTKVIQERTAGWYDELKTFLTRCLNAV